MSWRQKYEALDAIDRVLIPLVTKMTMADSLSTAIAFDLNSGYDNRIPVVFGFKQRDVLMFDGDPLGNACSKRHFENDLSNHWCHGLVMKSVDSTLQEFGLNTFFSKILASSVFIPKEYFIDKKPSAGDLGITEVDLVRINNGELSVSYFLDGLSILSFQMEF